MHIKENQQQLAKAKVSEETAWGLSFLALAMAFTESTISASNSSTFSYRNFVKNSQTEENARWAIEQSIIWASVGNLAVGAMAYIATGKDWRWAAATFMAGEILLAVHVWQFDEVLRDNRQLYNYEYVPSENAPAPVVNVNAMAPQGQ